MSNSVFVHSLLLAYLLFTISSCSSLAQVVCQNNGCDNTDSGCCTTSRSCRLEHPFTREAGECTPSLSTKWEPPTGVTICPFNYQIFNYEHCPNSVHTDRTQTVGVYGKPNWVGADFQSVSYNQFAMTVLWKHNDASKIRFYDLSNVSGYEIRIYETKKLNDDQANGPVLRQCLCVVDPSMRSISNITADNFQYSSPSHMTVEVRGYPSLAGLEESDTTRTNCSLLTGCSPDNRSEQCFNGGDCYSWPRSCLSFSSYNPDTCSPPLYAHPTNINAQTAYVYNNITKRNTTELTVSWQPPNMNYDLFPVPYVYYITVEGDGNKKNFKAINTTSVIISSPNISDYSNYSVYVSAYVPCSGYSDASATGSTLAGCGNESYSPALLRTPDTTTTPVPPTTTTPVPPTTTTPVPPTTTPDVNWHTIAISCIVVVAALALLIIIFVAAVCKKKKKPSCYSERYPMPSPPHNITEKRNIRVFVFYPKGTEESEETFIQTYIVAPLLSHRDYFKHIKSADDPDFGRGTLADSVDRNFRHADFIVIVCTSLLLDEWNSDDCSPTVRLLRQYIGNVMSIDDNTDKFITVVLDEHWKNQLHHSRHNLGSLASFVVNEKTWGKEIQSLVRYMTRTPQFQLTTNDEPSLDVLDTPDSCHSPNTDITYFSQGSDESTSRASNINVSDTDSSCSTVTQDNGMVCV